MPLQPQLMCTKASDAAVAVEHECVTAAAVGSLARVVDRIAALQLIVDHIHPYGHRVVFAVGEVYAVGVAEVLDEGRGHVGREGTRRVQAIAHIYRYAGCCHQSGHSVVLCLGGRGGVFVEHVGPVESRIGEVKRYALLQRGDVVAVLADTLGGVLVGVHDLRHSGGHAAGVAMVAFVVGGREVVVWLALVPQCLDEGSDVGIGCAGRSREDLAAVGSGIGYLVGVELEPAAKVLGHVGGVKCAAVGIAEYEAVHDVVGSNEHVAAV